MVKAKLDPQTMAEIKGGAVLTNAMPYIEAEIATRLRVIDNRALSAVNASDLTADAALGLWIERAVLISLSRSLAQRVLSSQTKAVTHQEELDL